METTINDVRYITLRKLSGFDQLHVFRKLLPLLSGLGQGFATIQKPDGGVNDQAIFTAVAPIADALSKMPREDVDEVIQLCLSKVLRVNPGGPPAPVLSSSGQPMFEDEMDMMTILQLVIAVVQENLGNFLPAVQPDSSGASTAPPLH